MNTLENQVPKGFLIFNLHIVDISGRIVCNNTDMDDKATA